MSKENPNREKARAIRARQRVIGRELRRIFDAVAQEPVPDEFLDLLRKMDAQDEPGKKSS
ncbi:MAG TPA: NepR family anti-sigma factor [Rhizomicrobium sp.]|nr:NepR family anti-sigma factor [Rhizomicrobium sp.]